MKRILIGLLTVAIIGGILFSGCVAAPPAPPSEAPVLGKTVQVTATFYLETGYQDAHDITVRIIVSEGFLKVSSGEWKGDLIRGDTYTLTTTIQAVKTGDWKIEALASSNKSDDVLGYAELPVSVPNYAPNLPDSLLPPPWPNVSYYFDANKTIIAKVGEEFTIGFDTFTRGGSHWIETHDEKMISLVDWHLVASPPAFNPATTWFLFKALQSGKTQITFKYYVPEELGDQKVFNIEIE